MNLSNIKISYDNDSNDKNISSEFLLPCLKSCSHYRRTTFSFSSNSLISWSGALAHVIQNQIKIQILCDMTQVLIRDDNLRDSLSLIDDKEKRYELICSLQDNILSEAMQFDSDLNNRDSMLLILDWMIAKGDLELKFAYPKKIDFFRKETYPNYHKKMGYFKFSDGASVAFKGSWNETPSGAITGLEDCDVYTSDRDNDKDRLEETINKVDNDWDGRNDRFDLVPISDKFLEKIKKRAPENYEDLRPIVDEILKANRTEDEFKLYDHQKLVLEDWEKNQRRGIIKHATGSGKTVSALYGLKKHLKENSSCLILVPSKLLLKQWKDEIKVHIPECSHEILSISSETRQLNNSRNLRIYSDPHVGEPKIIIATMQSARKESFLSSVRFGNHLMLIVDEVHQMGSNENSNFFAYETGSRLGLSATPERYGDPEGTQKILDYFGGNLKPEYQLRDALGKALVDYEYNICRCYMNAKELDDWIRLSKEISKAAAKCRRNIDNQIIRSSYLERLIFERSKIAKEAKNKVEKAYEIIKKDYKEGQKWLVYCHSIDHMQELTELLLDGNIRASQYHSKIKGNKQKIIDDFTLNGGILVSIKCLDEGVDIPSISHALIIASDQNPRQFIQRRGRVLRKDRNDPSKIRAFIYDMFVSSQDLSEPSVKSLIRTELKRSYLFAEDATNSSECKRIIFDLAHDNDIDWNDIAGIDDLNVSEEDDND